VCGDGKRVSRRGFLAYVVAAGGALAAGRWLAGRRSGLRLRGHARSRMKRGLAVVHGSAPSPDAEPDTVRRMTRAAVDALGGMDRLVRPGARVVIKPNMAWVRPPELAANTNPWVVAALVEMCLEAGAARVKVMDHTISRNPQPAYRASGIAQAAAAAGAEVAYVDPGRFRTLPIPGGLALKSWPFYEDFVSARACDVLINVPVLKDHGTSRLTMGLKNALGMVGGRRGELHTRIHQKIADLHRVLKVDLTVLDAYRVLRRHGPTGGGPGDVDNSLHGARRIVAGTDPVAVDAYGAFMFGYAPDEIGFLRYAEQGGIGSTDWRRQLLREVSL